MKKLEMKLFDSLSKLHGRIKDDLAAIHSEIGSLKSDILEMNSKQDDFDGKLANMEQRLDDIEHNTDILLSDIGYLSIHDEETKEKYSVKKNR